MCIQSDFLILISNYLFIYIIFPPTHFTTNPETFRAISKSLKRKTEKQGKHQKYLFLKVEYGK